MNSAITAARGLAALRQQAVDAARVGGLPEASTLRPGAVVLGVTGPQRSELRTTVVLTAAGLFLAGGAVGYLVRGRDPDRR